MTNIPKTLTIAGSDASGGAGIQADLKTFEEYGTYGLSAINCIATMDPDNHWHHDVFPIEIEAVHAQLKTIFAGGEIAAMKTGMLCSVAVIALTAETLKKHDVKNIVIDPVMVCKGEDEVLNPKNANALRDLLIPLATVTVPNLFEAGILSGLGTLKNLEDMKKAAQIIHDKGAKNVVVKGGKALAGEDSIDLFFDGQDFKILTSEKIEPAFNHGAGCTFAAAITAGLANGLTVEEAVYKAKDFVTEAIRAGFAFNQFVGPVFHAGYRLNKQKPI